MPDLIDTRELPKPMRSTLTLAGIVALGAAGAIGLVAFVRSEARAEAATTTRTVLAEDIAAFKVEAREAASTAAAQAADKAIRDVVAPLTARIAEDEKRIEGHEREDNARQLATDRRVENLEQRRR